MKSINEFSKKKLKGELISMVTAYDFNTAAVIEESEIDAVLVGDSVAMVMHGHPHTTFATVDMMSLHTKAVCRAIKSKFVVTDIPFLIAHKQDDSLLNAAGEFINSGAGAVKIEGGEDVFHSIKTVIKAGIPVMGHLGLTPQSVHQLGGYITQAKEEHQANKIFEEARELERIGVFALVLECVPSELATRIKEELTIPVIGIGAGAKVDGQVLVVDDLLGRSNQKLPKFVRKYHNLFEETLSSLNKFQHDVVSGDFPNHSESYS